MANTARTKEFDEPQSLMHRTQRMLIDHKLSCLEVFEETGINYHWLKKFENGDFKNPSVNRVQSLYEFLAGKKLFEG